MRSKTGAAVYSTWSPAAYITLRSLHQVGNIEPETCDVIRANVGAGRAGARHERPSASRSCRLGDEALQPVGLIDGVPRHEEAIGLVPEARQVLGPYDALIRPGLRREEAQELDVVAVLLIPEELTVVAAVPGRPSVDVGGVVHVVDEVDLRALSVPPRGARLAADPGERRRPSPRQIRVGARCGSSQVRSPSDEIRSDLWLGTRRERLRRVASPRRALRSARGSCTRLRQRLNSYTCKCHHVDMSDSADVQIHGYTPESEKPPTIADVTVEGPGISITRPVDESTMSSIIALLFGATLAAPPRSGGGVGRRQGAPVQSGEPQPSSQWDGDLTLGEFLVETEAKTFAQKICAAGYYLMNFQAAESFNRDDVKAALVSAHEDMPANFARDWSSAASTNLIAAKPGESGQFYVPKTGRTAVESSFQEVPKRRASRRTPKKSAGSASNGATE